MFTRTLSKIVFCVALLASAMANAAERRVVDMAGTEVALAQDVERIVALGPVPVLNSLVFAVGEGRRIAAGLPASFARSPRWKFQYVFVPQIKDMPSGQTLDGAPDLETLLQIHPDVILTASQVTAEKLRQIGLPALYIALTTAEDVKTAVGLMGRVLDRQELAAQYARRFDAILAMVSSRLAQGQERRPRVLYFQPATLTQPHLIAEWWIPAAGGESLTSDGRTMEARSFTLEQLMAWDPELIIVPGGSDVQTLQQDERFSGLSAVRNHKVLVAPCGAHLWSHRTSELPLAVLWAAKNFHPALFADVDVASEAGRFYREQYGISLSDEQVREILGGSSAPN